MNKKLTEKQGKYLLALARGVIAIKLNDDTFLKNENSTLKNKNELIQNRGTFVTIHINNSLRGCIGSIEPYENIIDNIKRNALNAAFNDPRFTPLTIDEFKKIDLEISILTKPEKIIYQDTTDLLSQLKPFHHGVILEKNNKSATFLPQVWEQLPGKDEFLTHLCMKAGLPAKDWEKGLCEILIYSVQYFKDDNNTEH